MHLAGYVLLFVSLLPLRGVRADTPLSDEFVQADLANNDGAGIAFASRPVWNFALFTLNLVFFKRQYKPCYPGPALVDGQLNGTQPDIFPRAGTNCPDPGALEGGEGNPFPTYYVVTKCKDDEIRVIYGLYTSHDGFSDVLIAKGHEHDWERIIVTWTRNSTTSAWTRNTLLKSFHSGYSGSSWASVPSTIDPTVDAPTLTGKRSSDSPLVYVGWGKHANFDDANTGCELPACQGCSTEYRDNHWWFLPREEDLVDVSLNSQAGQEMSQFDFGSATGSPWHAAETVCEVDKSEYLPC